MTEPEWEGYEERQKQFPEALIFEKEDLLLKNSFNVEWIEVRRFLDTLPKPACLIAHNGLYFDYRILYGEMVRYNLLQSDPLPQGIVFIDSMLAFQNIEEDLKLRLDQALLAVNRQSGQTVPLDHPFNIFRKSEWPTAVFRRFASDFKKNPSGHKWEFVPSAKKYNLSTIYHSIIGPGAEFHYAQDDSEAVLQISLAFGKEFLAYMDSAAAIIPF